MYKPFPRTFFQKDPVTVAKALLGQLLVRVLSDNTILVGMISEVEAYLGELDPASHSYRGKTNRTRVLFEEAGLAYIYSIHQQHCLDITCETIGRPGSVLIRGIIPIEGIEVMRKNRGKPDLSEKLLANGPGKLTRAFSIDKSLYGVDMTSTTSGLFVAKGKMKTYSFTATTRVGISKAKGSLLRFLLNLDNTKPQS